MTTEIKGNYFSRLKFGGQDLVIDPAGIQEFSIIQDIDRFLPYMRLRMVDPQGGLTHILPFDKQLSRMSLDLSNKVGDNIKVSYDFLVYRRMPESAYNTAAYYDIEGLLNVDGLFAPDRSRGWTDSVSTVLTDIATDDLELDGADISTALDYTANIVQPCVPNAQFLSDLKDRLVGKNGQAPYKMFVRVEQGLKEQGQKQDARKVFVCKSIPEFYSQEVKYKFIVNDEPYQDHLPVFEYSIYDNYRMYGVFGASQQAYSYFDYDTGAFTESIVGVTDYLSLSEYLLIDNEDTSDSVSVKNMGRGDSITSNAGSNRAVSGHYNRLSNMVNLWILSFGIATVQPGDIVRVVFGQGINEGKVFSYQYSGYWMVKRVVHMLGRTFKTRLLLVRAGIDTDQNTSLVAASKKKV